MCEFNFRSDSQNEDDIGHEQKANFRLSYVDYREWTLIS